MMLLWFWVINFRIRSWFESWINKWVKMLGTGNNLNMFLNFIFAEKKKRLISTKKSAYVRSFQRFQKRLYIYFTHYYSQGQEKHCQNLSICFLCELYWILGIWKASHEVNLFRKSLFHKFLSFPLLFCILEKKWYLYQQNCILVE